MKKLKELCTPRASIFDRAKRDTVLDLSDLVEGTIDAKEFFEENFVTDAMRVLLTEGLRRLEGKSEQGVFLLRQAMGGGKTHNLLAMGLLARHPEIRKSVLAGIYTPEKLGAVKVVAFSGRETDTPFGIWGAIAEQLGKADSFKEYYSPLSAPGQTAWIKLLDAAGPVLILLDELPPYIDNAFSKSIGDSNLARVTATALTNLFVAIGKGKLPQVCVILTDLSARHYQDARNAIQGILDNLEDEAGRLAMSLEPVKLGGDEFYHILRKRLFSGLPAKPEVEKVAQGYAKAVKEARQMGVTDQSPEQFAASVEAAYPFHPAIKDLYARFRENPGFQQTRALIRLMRIIVSHLYQAGKAEHQYLVCAHDVDLNDQDTLGEINQINSTLGNALSHDIAAEGKSVAEIMDQNLGGSDVQDATRLIFMSSLANVPNAIVGLSIPEIVAYLAAPGRDISKLKTEVLEKLSTAAWFLHANKDNKLYFRNVENLYAQLEGLSKTYVREQAVKEVKTRLEQMFEPKQGWCYQQVLALVAPDEIELSQDKVTLVVFEPSPGQKIHPDLVKFFQDTPWKNRVAFLTGSKDTYNNSLLDNGKRLKAIQHILDDNKTKGMAENDPQHKLALDLSDKLQHNFLAACRETFTILHYPTKLPGAPEAALNNADFTMKFIGNKYDGEQQVKELLKSKMKFEENITGDIFRKKCEAKLFTTRTIQWSQVKVRAGMDASWQWHIPSALDALKAVCLKAEIWREDGTYVDKGPFPKAATSVSIQERGRDDDTGEVELKVTPVNGDTVYVEIGGPATTASEKVDGPVYRTSEMRVSFLAVDSSKQHETGPTRDWVNTVTLKHKLEPNGPHQLLTLKAAPGGAIRYSSDGSDPKVAGGVYDSPVLLKPGTSVVLAYAEEAGVESAVERIDVTWGKDKQVVIDPVKPVAWMRVQKNLSTKDAYAFAERLKSYEAQALEVIISISVSPDEWLEFRLGKKVAIEGMAVYNTIEYVRNILPAGEVGVEAGSLKFAKGQQLLDWAHEVKAHLVPTEVVQ